MKQFANDALARVAGSRSLKMKTGHLIAMLSLLIGVVADCRPVLAGEKEGIALAIIYDTSGSMREPVADANGKPTPKYIIANRALIAIAKQIESFAPKRADGAPRRIDAGLYIFKGTDAVEAVKFGPFDAASLESWAGSFSTPAGNT